MSADVEDLSQLMGEAKPVPPSAPINQPPHDEVGPAYVEHRQSLEGRAALSSLLSESQPAQGQTGENRGTSQKPLNATEQSIVDQTLGQSSQPTSLLDKVGHTAGAIAKDVGTGLLEAPVHGLYQGVRDSFQSMLDGAADLGKWIEKKADIPGIKYDFTGKGPVLSIASEHEMEGLHRPFEGTELPNAGEPKSVTGGVIKSAAQFVTSMSTLGRAFGPMGTDAEGILGHLATAGKSAAALFTGFDKASGNLADLVEKAPSLSNPITRFFQSSPDDNEAEGRLKNAITGVGFGELQNGLLAALRMMRGAMTAKAQVAEIPETPGPAGTAEQKPIETPAAWKFLGDPDAPPGAPLAEMRTPDLQVDKELRAQAATEGLTPEGVAAMRGPAPEVPTQYHVDEDEIHHVVSENGETTAKVRGDQLQILDTQTAEVGRGQGEGTARIARMADEAADRGLTLASDTKVSDAAAKVYDRLEQQGYPVTRNPAEPDGEGNLVATAGRPVFEVGPKAGVTPGDVPGAAGAGIKEPQTYINFARIDTPDDVKQVMSQLADAQKENIDIAKRGIRDFETTKLGANFQDAWKTLMERRSGQPLNAEQQLAGRQLLAQSATKAEQLTQMAIDNPTPENLFAWRKQMSTHAMIQAEVSGSQAEIARSLGAMRIPVSAQGAIDRFAAITQQLDQMGGLKSNMDFLQATKTLIDSGKLEELGNVAEKSVYAKTRDGLITAWTNGLLTNPLTHVKVNLSNIGTIALRMTETRLAEALDSATDYDGVPAGEAAQTAAGLVSGIKDSFRYIGSLMRLNEAPESSPIQDAAKAFKTGQYSVGEKQTDWTQQGQEASNALSIADNGGFVGKATDLMSSVVTSPGRALAGEHEFYRSIGMRMELQRFAYRQAMRELGAGKIDADELAGRVAELVEKNPANINTQAVAGMTYQTFTDAPGKLAEIISNLRQEYPLVRVILPFYKIPARIMSFTFERSPLAPLMAGWRADIAAGGARQSMALAKTGLGSMVMLAASDAVLNGTITGQGPTDRGQRQAMMDEGWLPYSIRTPSGRWVQYNRLETVGSSMALAADIAETTRDYFTAVNADDPNVEKITAAGIAAIANNVTSKTYFEGLARFFDTISDPRANADNFLKSQAGSLVPAGVGAVASLMDPYQRATYSMMDAIKARTPGVSKDLPPLTNVWGEPVRRDSGLGKAYDAFVPFATRRPSNEPIDQEILKQGMHVTLPPQKTSIGGATVDLGQDPQLYHRYVELAGNDYKSPAWGVGAKDLLNQIVSGTHPLSTIYNMKSDGPDGGKALMIRGIVEQYRREAGQKLLAGKVSAVKERQSQLKMPVLVGASP